MIKIISFILVTLFLIITLKAVKSNLPPLISVFVVVILLTISITNLMPTIEFLNSISQKVNFNNNYLKIILKCIAICYLGSFCSNICKDNGENSLALGADVICKCTIISLTLPIYMDVFEWILKLWENT